MEARRYELGNNSGLRLGGIKGLVKGILGTGQVKIVVDGIIKLENWVEMVEMDLQECLISINNNEVVFGRFNLVMVSMFRLLIVFHFSKCLFRSFFPSKFLHRFFRSRKCPLTFSTSHIAASLLSIILLSLFIIILASEAFISYQVIIHHQQSFKRGW